MSTPSRMVDGTIGAVDGPHRIITSSPLREPGIETRGSPTRSPPSPRSRGAIARWRSSLSYLRALLRESELPRVVALSAEKILSGDEPSLRSR